MAPIITLSFGAGPNVILHSGVGYHLLCYRLGMVLNVTISWHGTTVTILWLLIPNADTSAKCNAIVHSKFVATNVIIIIGLIQVTVPNAFPGSLFINPHCDHAVFERSTDRKWHNSSGTSSNSQGDSVEQSCLSFGNSKTRTLHHN